PCHCAFARSARCQGRRYIQPEGLFSRLRGDKQSMSAEIASTVDITLSEVERARILAHTAKFDPPSAATSDGRRDLVGMSREELAVELAAIGEAPFRVKQLWHWIYH